MKEMLLGFDARIVDWQQFTTKWPQNEREKYLLRPDIAAPLSVDAAVTPSVFRIEDSKKKPDDRIALRATGIRQQSIGLWPDLEALQRSLRLQSHGGGKFVLLAITICSEITPAERSWWSEVLAEPTSPDSLDSTWIFEGFDVGDRWLTSYLYRVTLADPALRVQRQKWFESISSVNGLIRTIERASDYARFLELSLPAHAPYLVYAIHSMVEEEIGVGRK